MEILQIKGGRLKITLTKNDLREYEIDGEELNAADPSAKRALDALFAVVEAKTGTRIVGLPAYIQMYPSKDGGCEIFVQKSRGKTGVGETVPVPRDRDVYYLCRFDEREKAEALLAALLSRGEKAALYRLFDRYCLISGAAGGSALLLEEFGNKMGVDPSAWLREHATALSGNCRSGDKPTKGQDG